MAKRTVLSCNVAMLFLCGILFQVESAQVATEEGVVEGIVRVTAEKGETYHAFLGIPYAIPPIGRLRFLPPQPTSWTDDIWNATYERSVCVQNTNGTSIIGSEDCLYLNVFSTELPTTPNCSLKPVMFWIHGGAFAIGSGNIGEQGPDDLLDDGVVVVTINYRLGLFGFLSTGDLVAPGNNGLRDQILALNWVKTNIASFGGDPNHVTVFGESAGGASIGYLIQSPLAAGLFCGAIMESGTPTCQWSLSRGARKFAFDVGRELLIDADDSDTLVDRLREIDCETLQVACVNVNDQVDPFNAIQDIPAAPVTEPVHAGAVFTSESCSELGAGRFTRVPILVGFNSAEGNTFAPVFAQQMSRVETYYSNQSLLVLADMKIDDFEIASKVGRLIRTHYEDRCAPSDAVSTLRGFYFSDGFFVKPIRKFVEIVQHYVSTYYYEFSYQGPLGNPDREGLIGVGHAEELSYIFRGENSASPADELTRKRLVRMWTNFAKYGNPTPVPEELLQGITWGPSASRNLDYLKIDCDLEMKTDPHPYDMNFWDSLYDAYSNPPCDTF